MPWRSSERVRRKVRRAALARLGEGARHHPAGHRGAGDGIDQHEAAGVALLRERLDDGRAADLDARHGDVVGGAGGGGALRQRRQVEVAADIERRDRDKVGRRAQQVAAAAVERLVGEPHQPRLEAAHRCRHRRRAAASTAPRDTSMSVSSCSTTAWPAPALSRSRSMVTMRLTRARRPLTASTTSPPRRDLARCDGAGEAAEILARAHHHLHGEAEAAAGSSRPRGALAARHLLQVRRAAAGRRTRACAPSGARRCRPARPRRGWPRRRGRRSGRASARNSASMARKRASDQSTRSILLTARTTLPTPIRSRMAAWRRVCTFTPLRASTSRMATSAWDGAGGHVARVLLVAGAVDDDEAAPRPAPRAYRSSARRCRW